MAGVGRGGCGDVGRVGSPVSQLARRYSPRSGKVHASAALVAAKVATATTAAVKPPALRVAITVGVCPGQGGHVARLSLLPPATRRAVLARMMQAAE